MLAEMERLIPDILEGISSGRFAEVESISIDYAVMEHAKHCSVVPYKGVWNDIGSFRTLHEVLEKDERDNHFGTNLPIRTEGTVTNNLVLGETKHRINLLGVSNLVVVVTEDEILIADMDKCQEVKRLNPPS